MALTLFFEHPFALTCRLLILRAVLGLVAGEFLAKWLFISIFIVFLGGIIILFFYLVSLSRPYKMIEISPLSRTLILFLIFLIPTAHYNIIPQNFFLFHLYNFLGFQALLILAFLLFLCLIIVVKLTENFKGGISRTW